MTPLQLRLLFPSAPTFIGGADYALPTLAWLQGPFWDYFKGELWDDNLDKWQVRWECRDFARAFATFAQVCNALTPVALAGTDALAIGEFWYHIGGDPATGHAINVCMTDQGQVFIEPQNGQQVHLTDVEISSCFFVRF